MKYRKLRIAWSAYFGVLCLSLAVLLTLSLSNLEYARRMILPLLAGTAVLTTVPWLPGRFGLRTLLVGMTVIAVLIGLVIWAMGS